MNKNNDNQCSKCKGKQINTQHVNCQNESIITKKNNLSGPAIMEDVKPKVHKMYESTTKEIEDWSTSSPNQERGVKSCVMVRCVG